MTLRDLSAGAHQVTVSMAGRQTYTTHSRAAPGRLARHRGDARARGAGGGAQRAAPDAAGAAAARCPRIPSAQPQPLRNEHPGRTAKIVAGVLVGAAVVPAAVAIYTWRTYSDLESSAHADLEGLKPMPVPQQDQAVLHEPVVQRAGGSAGTPGATKYNNDCSSGNNYANATTGLWVATGALAAAGVVSFVIGDRQAAKAKERRHRDPDAAVAARRAGLLDARRWSDRCVRVLVRLLRFRSTFNIPL